MFKQIVAHGEWLSIPILTHKSRQGGVLSVSIIVKKEILGNQYCPNTNSNQHNMETATNLKVIS